MQAPAQLSNPLQLPPPLVKNCLVTATNSTLVPSLIANAAAVTPQPLLVYITTNVSIGAFPSLPATGVPINRPVVFVGLQSLVTSIDFQMVVNQLNATGSQYSNVTFVGLALENLAPGDATTSTVAAPFSIAISNNVWAVFYNRCGSCAEPECHSIAAGAWCLFVCKLTSIHRHLGAVRLRKYCASISPEASDLRIEVNAQQNPKPQHAQRVVLRLIVQHLVLFAAFLLQDGSQ